MYDAIIVGARCAGASAALLLARKGYRVLLLDRGSFPSDTISTHIIWPPGAARLMRWGLLDRVFATNCPPIETVTVDVGPFALVGSPTPADGVSQVLAPRRIALDQILVDAAVAAGAELRELAAVHDVVRDADRVTGVRHRTADGSETKETARIVIGADGKRSVIARAVGAREYNARPPRTCWYYTYWSGVPTDGIQFYSRPNRAIGIIPTNDGQVCIPVAWTAQEFHAFRADIETNYLNTIGLASSLAERVRQGRREERFIGMADIPNFFRTSSGPGWALVGDAGYHKDPIAAQGISDAFRQAESLADAVDAAFTGRLPLDVALQRYGQTRDAEAMPMYEFTLDWATLAPPPPAIKAFLAAVARDRRETDRYFGAIAGTVPIPEFFSPEHMQRVIDAR